MLLAAGRFLGHFSFDIIIGFSATPSLFIEFYAP